MNTEPTDWDAYYQNTPAYTSITRAISGKKLVTILKNHVEAGTATVCELRGGNSCFVDQILGNLKVTGYHVIDNNFFALQLLSERKSDPRLTVEKSDILDSLEAKPESFDVVFSVGLVEHFAEKETRKAIRTHFDLCKRGGLVLITFPTPTSLYKLLRFTAEIIKVWSLPDERPLLFSEVEGTCEENGVLLHRSINWWIGFTQGYLVYRKT